MGLEGQRAIWTNWRSDAAKSGFWCQTRVHRVGLYLCMCTYTYACVHKRMLYAVLVVIGFVFADARVCRRWLKLISLPLARRPCPFPCSVIPLSTVTTMLRPASHRDPIKGETHTAAAFDKAPRLFYRVCELCSIFPFFEFLFLPLCILLFLSAHWCVWTSPPRHNTINSITNRVRVRVIFISDWTDDPKAIPGTDEARSLIIYLIKQVKGLELIHCGICA